MFQYRSRGRVNVNGCRVGWSSGGLVAGGLVNAGAAGYDPHDRGSCGINWPDGNRRLQVDESEAYRRTSGRHGPAVESTPRAGYKTPDHHSPDTVHPPCPTTFTASATPWLTCRPASRTRRSSGSV